MRPMMVALGVALVAVLSGVEAFKLGFGKPAALPAAPVEQPAPVVPPEFDRYVQSHIYQQQQEFQQEQRDLGTKGGYKRPYSPESLGDDRLAPVQQQQQQALAYVFIRPVPMPHLLNLDSRQSGLFDLLFGGANRAPFPEQQLIPLPAPAATKGTKGGPEVVVQKELEIPGPPPAEPIVQEPIGQEPELGAHLALAKGHDKLAKLKSHFDKLKSKLTLGSSYQVHSEELVAPLPQPPVIRAPIVQQEQQQQLKQGHEEDIKLTQQEQEKIKDAEREEQQQVQQHPYREAPTAVKQPEAPLEQQQQQPQPQLQEDNFDRREQKYREQSRLIGEHQQYTGTQQQEEISRINKGRQ